MKLSDIEGGAEAKQEAGKASRGADGDGTRATNLSVFQSRKQEVLCPPGTMRQGARGATYDVTSAKVKKSKIQPESNHAPVGTPSLQEIEHMVHV